MRRDGDLIIYSWFRREFQNVKSAMKTASHQRMLRHFNHLVEDDQLYSELHCEVAHGDADRNDERGAMNDE